MEQDVREYLDGCVRHWRDIRDGKTPSQAPTPDEAGDGDRELLVVAEARDLTDLRDVAPYYIDAFQSARLSLVGSILKEDA